MRFRSPPADEPDINLIPFIDILLVVLIFLMLTTTFNRFRELQVSLPVADATPPQQASKQIRVAISADGRFSVNRQPLDTPTLEGLIDALQQATADPSDTMVLIQADAAASHQSVVDVMEAARRSGLAQLTFTTRRTSRSVARSGP